MDHERAGSEAKETYVEPRVLATYSKEELARTIRPHGPQVSYTEPGCAGCAGCGCGCSVP